MKTIAGMSMSAQDGGSRNLECCDYLSEPDAIGPESVTCLNQIKAYVINCANRQDRRAYSMGHVVVVGVECAQTCGISRFHTSW